MSNKPLNQPKSLPIPYDEKGNLLCSYCDDLACFHNSSEFLYNGRDYGPVWDCKDCQAWVGCHKDTNKPLGRLADAGLRRAKQAAHAAFDPLWRPAREEGIPGARSTAYTWLAKRLGIKKDMCHIGQMNDAMCYKVVEICSKTSYESIFPIEETSSFKM